nr:MAG TPA: hypothetical protein [Caudoviricetes sp.]
MGRRRAHRIAEARHQPIREITFTSPTAREIPNWMRVQRVARAAETPTRKERVRVM